MGHIRLSAEYVVRRKNTYSTLKKNAGFVDARNFGPTCCATKKRKKNIFFVVLLHCWCCGCADDSLTTELHENSLNQRNPTRQLHFAMSAYYGVFRGDMEVHELAADLQSCMSAYYSHKLADETRYLVQGIYLPSEKASEHAQWALESKENAVAVSEFMKHCGVTYWLTPKDSKGASMRCVCVCVCVLCALNHFVWCFLVLQRLVTVRR